MDHDGKVGRYVLFQDKRRMAMILVMMDPKKSALYLYLDFVLYCFVLLC
jgi:hypothetical protein